MPFMKIDQFNCVSMHYTLGNLILPSPVWDMYILKSYFFSTIDREFCHHILNWICTRYIWFTTDLNEVCQEPTRRPCLPVLCVAPAAWISSFISFSLSVLNWILCSEMLLSAWVDNLPSKSVSKYFRFTVCSCVYRSSENPLSNYYLYFLYFFFICL